MNFFTGKINFSPNEKGISTSSLKIFQSSIKALNKNEVPQATLSLLKLIDSEQISISDKLLEMLSQQLETAYGPLESYKREQKQDFTMTDSSEKAEKRMQEIINRIENDEKIEKHVVELQDSAKEELKDALSKFHRHKDAINVLRHLGEAQGGKFKVSELMQNLDQIEKKTGVDFKDQQSIESLVRNLQQVEQELEDAHQKMIEADHELKQVEEGDVQIDEHLSVLEEEELQWTQEAREVAEKLNGPVQWSG